jgi:hypothetical protein
MRYIQPMNTNTTPSLVAGQLVKFAAPLNDSEATQRYEVVEYRAARPEIGDTRPDRVLVRFVCDMRLPPTDVFEASELVPA